jgi:hypothetical protein
MQNMTIRNQFDGVQDYLFGVHFFDSQVKNPTQ